MWPINSLLSILLISFLTLVALVGLILLQVYLAKKRNAILGLIVPAITFVISLVIFIIALPVNASFLLIVYLFFMLNIPTFIFIIIYLICHRKSLKQRSEIDRMSIMDLE